MRKTLTVLALMTIAIVTGHIADSRAVTQLAEASATPPLMYAGVRG